MVFFRALVLLGLTLIGVAMSAATDDCKDEIACVNVYDQTVTITVPKESNLDAADEEGLYRFDMKKNPDLDLDAKCQSGDGAASINFKLDNDIVDGSVSDIESPFEYSTDGQTWTSTPASDETGLQLLWVRCSDQDSAKPTTATVNQLTRQTRGLSHRRRH
ncbi:unnamed protein product [Parajaminaea phylloscopi]